MMSWLLPDLPELQLLLLLMLDLSHRIMNRSILIAVVMTLKSHRLYVVMSHRRRQQVVTQHRKRAVM
jgi:hypothetical protein